MISNVTGESYRIWLDEPVNLINDEGVFIPPDLKLPHKFLFSFMDLETGREEEVEYDFLELGDDVVLLHSVEIRSDEIIFYCDLG